jgi:hypothetical protein
VHGKINNIRGVLIGQHKKVQQKLSWYKLSFVLNPPIQSDIFNGHLLDSSDIININIILSL